MRRKADCFCHSSNYIQSLRISVTSSFRKSFHPDVESASLIYSSGNRRVICILNEERFTWNQLLGISLEKVLIRKISILFLQIFRQISLQKIIKEILLKGEPWEWSSTVDILMKNTKQGVTRNKTKIPCMVHEAC